MVSIPAKLFTNQYILTYLCTAPILPTLTHQSEFHLFLQNYDVHFTPESPLNPLAIKTTTPNPPSMGIRRNNEDSQKNFRVAEWDVSRGAETSTHSGTLNHSVVGPGKMSQSAEENRSTSHDRAPPSAYMGGKRSKHLSLDLRSTDAATSYASTSHTPISSPGRVRSFSIYWRLSHSLNV
jgi:hypothetical protein